MPIIISTPSLPSLTFFADSSSRDRDFMVAGGFAVSSQRIYEIEHYIAELRMEAGIGEFHWADYRGGPRKAAYEKLVRYGFELIKKRQAALHLIIAEFKNYKHKAVPGENRDTSINRMYYQLCLHRPAQFYGKVRSVHVRLDAGNDSAIVCNMRNQLCADAYRQYGTKPNCVRTIEPMCSSKSGIIQMADVIIGAVAAKRNAVEHRSPKRELARLVLEISGRESWKVDTAWNARFLTVWNHKTKKGPPQS